MAREAAWLDWPEEFLDGLKSVVRFSEKPSIPPIWPPVIYVAFSTTYGSYGDNPSVDLRDHTFYDIENRGH